MNKMRTISNLATCALVVVLTLHFGATATHAGQDGRKLYQEHCASCHGADRLGGTGPALLPQNLKRLRQKRARRVIARGKAATQMPAFADTLDAAQIEALTAFIFSKPKIAPRWTKADIEASRTVSNREAAAVSKPVYKADPLNLFVVVESGNHHIVILDGDRFEPLYRFKSHFALHGGPKFTPDGRYVFFASRDGWVTKFDLYALKVVADVRAGINTRNIAISADGKHIAVANYLPHTLIMLKASDLSVEKVFDVRDRWKKSSRVSAVYQARPRNSFIAALKDVKEVWEISTDPNAPAQFGFVHSNEKGMKEALSSTKGLFALRRIEVRNPLDDFFFDQSYRHLIGAWRRGRSAQVINLPTGQTIADFPLAGLPHLGSGITFDFKGKRVMATPHLRENKISLVEMTDWKVIKTITTKGPGFFMRSHENTPYAWAGVFFGPNRDLVHIIDKRSFEIVKTLRPVPGKTAAHVEFDRYGKHALLSVWDQDGAIIVYDAKTFEPIKTLKMNRPAGKYNVFNKINLSEGTSH